MDVSAYIRLLRPKQWLKNLMLLFPPFLAGDIFSPGVLLSGLWPFVSFCFASSSAYILNDIIDSGRDLCHPVKCGRPIPCGDVSKLSAGLLGFVFLIAGLIIASGVAFNFIWFLVVYLFIAIFYSLFLKNFPIVDIFCIASGFVVRLFAGGNAFGIEISAWLFLSVFLLALFLSTGKRAQEKIVLGDDADDHRRSLSGYPPGFLEGVMYLCGGAVLVTYSIYSVTRHALVYTVPLCVFGLFRYIMLARSGTVGDPTESLLRDPQLFLTSVLWVTMVGWSIYGR